MTFVLAACGTEPVDPLAGRVLKGRPTQRADEALNVSAAESFRRARARPDRPQTEGDGARQDRDDEGSAAVDHAVAFFGFGWSQPARESTAGNRPSGRNRTRFHAVERPNVNTLLQVSCRIATPAGNVTDGPPHSPVTGYSRVLTVSPESPGTAPAIINGQRGWIALAHAPGGVGFAAASSKRAAIVFGWPAYPRSVHTGRRRPYGSNRARGRVTVRPLSASPLFGS